MSHIANLILRNGSMMLAGTANCLWMSSDKSRPTAMEIATKYLERGVDRVYAVISSHTGTVTFVQIDRDLKKNARVKDIKPMPESLKSKLIDGRMKAFDQDGLNYDLKLSRLRD